MVYESALGDYFYIVVGLLWVAFSIYKGTQKQKKPQKPDGEKVKPTTDIEQILGEFLGVKADDAVYTPHNEDIKPTENVLVEEPDVNDLTPKMTSEVFSYDDEFEEGGNFFKEKKVYTPDTVLKEGEKTLIKSDAVKKRVKTRINLRKAIIYSEILKRPSY